ncbi:MAG: MFS transporter, partial [Rhodospirillaceae bacterium]
MSTAAKATAEVTDGSKVTMRQWAILGVCFTTSTLYAMTLLVVSVILPQVQGSLSASPDQISWTVTFNILATAIVTPISGWLAGRWGARNVMLFCMAGFGLASLA